MADIFRFEDYLTENANVKTSHFQYIADELKCISLKKGGFLFREGEVSSSFFYVEKGVLRLYSIDKVGKEHIVQFASEGWFIGDRTSIYFREPSKFHLEAIEESQVVVLDESIFNTLCQHSTEFLQYNERILQNHIRHLQNRIHLLISASAEERYLDFVKTYPDLTQRIPQWMIASYLGITPESLSRVRNELAKK